MTFIVAVVCQMFYCEILSGLISLYHPDFYHLFAITLCHGVFVLVPAEKQPCHQVCHLCLLIQSRFSLKLFTFLTRFSCLQWFRVSNFWEHFSSSEYFCFSFWKHDFLSRVNLVCLRIYSEEWFLLWFFQSRVLSEPPTRQIHLKNTTLKILVTKCPSLDFELHQAELFLKSASCHLYVFSKVVPHLQAFVFCCFRDSH